MCHRQRNVSNAQRQIQLPRVLIVTGGMLSASEPSIAKAIGKQIASFRASSGAWLDIQLKILASEALLASRLERGSRGYEKATYKGAVDRFFAASTDADPPELTEVVLATLLAAEGIPFDVAAYGDLYADAALRDRLLDASTCVFASTTLIRDLSELAPMVALLKRPHNRVVAGGALGAILHHAWPGVPGLDVLAVGYGELLVPSLAAWIRGGFGDLTPPSGGRVVRKEGTWLLYSGLPATKDLDFLPSPDWSLAERVHGRKFALVHYESVRGCPYRCAFCNYPFLFDDTKFRYRSAERIADDWARLAAMGVKFVSCLDSLFTMPKRRLVRLCNLLLERGIVIKWICYARADDLGDLETCRLMKRAGCHQVQIGVESGSQAQLDNMNKRCTVEANKLALRNCREVGITTLATVIVGFPGETAETIEQSFQCLRESPPDIYYLAPFNTRVEYVPILNDESRARFGIETETDGRSSAPYWRHDTMECTEVGEHIRRFHRRMAEDEVALEGTVFYTGLLSFDARDREHLLDFQRDVSRRHPVVRWTVGRLNAWAQRRLERDARRTFARDRQTSDLPGRAVSLKEARQRRAAEPTPGNRRRLEMSREGAA